MTGTTVGLKPAFAESTELPAAFTFGYKRKELSIIPVDAQRQPSVLATFNTEAGIDAAGTSGGGGAVPATRSNAKFGFKQYVATGDAAVQLSTNPQIRKNLQDAVVAGMTPLKRYYVDASEQSATVLGAMSCLIKVDDGLLPRVWINGDDLEVFHVPGAPALIRAKPVAGQREQYLLEIVPRARITKADTVIYRASQADCVDCATKDRCCLNTPFCKIARSIHEGAREVARSIVQTLEYRQSLRDRKKVEMLFAHLKRIMKLDRLRLRGLSGAQNEFLMAATA